MNRVFLIGRLSRDPDLRHTNNGTPVCLINVAVNRQVSQGKEQEADFINVTIWNKQAENVARYLTKGRQVAVEGRIQVRSYDNTEGKRTYVTEVVANNVEFLGSANDNRNGQTSIKEENPFDIKMMQDYGEQQSTTSVDEDPFASFGEKIEINDSELPF